MSTENRVPSTRFSTETPQSGLLEMENGNCLPSDPNIIILSGEIKYIKPVERIIVNKISCLGYLASLCNNHIPHQYSSEVRKKTETVSIASNV